MDYKYEPYPPHLTTQSAKPPHKGVFNVSSPSTREGIDGSSNAQEEMGQTSLRKERVCYKRAI